MAEFVRRKNDGNHKGPARNFKNNKPKRWDIECTSCGAKDQVPFKPDPGSDVLCRSCHEVRKEEKEKLRKRHARTDRRTEKTSRRGASIPRLDHGTRVAFPIVCDSCGKRETLSYAPKVTEDVFCTSCLEERRGKSWRHVQAEAERAKPLPRVGRRMRRMVDVEKANPERIRESTKVGDGLRIKKS